MNPLEQTKVVVVFRSRLRDEVNLSGLEAAAVRMYELASAMPGFISYKDFSADDGESVAIVEFSDMNSLLEWRNHPEHRAMQKRGREEFFSAYEIQVCEPVRAYSFDSGH